MSNPFTLSKRIQAIKPSITLAVTAKAKQLKAQGVDVIGFGAGEPDFGTPAHIGEAAKEAISRGETRYTPAPGTIRLREAVAKDLNEAHGLRFEANNIVVTCGAKHALYELFQVLLNADDEVLIPAPYWVSYPDMVTLAEGVPVIIPTSADADFKLTPEALKKHISDRTRALVLNSPSNPTGAGYTREQLEALRPILEERNILVISDDIYRHLTYDGFEFCEMASLSDKMRNLTIVVDGLSKSHAMTGWRCGWAAGPTDLMKAMGKLQGQCTSNISSITQAAAIAALEGPQDEVAKMRAAFDERRKTMVGRLRDIPDVSCAMPVGAFYAFPDFSSYCRKKTPDGKNFHDDAAFCTWLLDHAKVAIVPGSGFGAPGHARLSYATSSDNIAKGLDRLEKALGELVEP